jgi:hypothetical protein
VQIADERDYKGHVPVEEIEMKATKKEIVR